MSKKISWTTQKRKISDLLPTENNPRTLNEKQHKDLKKSLSKFDLAEIPAINTNNKILAGHQRLKVLFEINGDAEIDVRVPNRELTEKESQEYLVRSNANTGSWDFDLLANEFELEDLTEWGLYIPQVDDEEEKEDVKVEDNIDAHKVDVVISCDQLDLVDIINDIEKIKKNYKNFKIKIDESL